MLPSFANDTVTRIRPGTIERRGSVEPDWDNATTLTISGCSIQPAATTLTQDGRVLGISDGLTAYLPPNADVAAGDKIQFNGQVYQIMGEPRCWKSATGRATYTQASLERWVG